MNLQQWCTETEELAKHLRLEYWNMSVGLPYSEKKIGELEEKSGKQTSAFLAHFKEPQDLVDDCIGSVAGSKTFKEGLALQDARKKIIVSSKHKLKGNPVSWQTWRQFAASANDDERKHVYDEFIALSKNIAPIVKRKFDVAGKTYADYDTNPLDAYARSHRMSVKHLRKVIGELKEGIKKDFVKQNKHYSEVIFGREPHYYDDFYVIRNKLYDGITMPKIDPVKSVFATIRGMGLNPDGVILDSEDRPGKYASPFMTSIVVPTDVRVSYKPENPFNDLNSIYHEYGHAMHYKSIKAELPFWTRNCISEGLAETFSIFFDKLLMRPGFLQHIGFKDETANELKTRTRYKELYGAAFYCANSLFKIDSWEKQVPFDELAPLYAKYVKECMGLEIPGEYWLLHHILPDSLMYVPSYMLAEMQVSELHARFEKEHGPNWWASKKVGVEVDALMNPGSDSPAATFEKINPKMMIKNLVTDR